ncbi:MAG: hypothetical protein AB7K24_24210, partial [Gemmataceae bacterium]
AVNLLKFLSVPDYNKYDQELLKSILKKVADGTPLNDIEQQRYNKYLYDQEQARIKQENLEKQQAETARKNDIVKRGDAGETLTPEDRTYYDSVLKKRADDAAKKAETDRYNDVINRGKTGQPLTESEQKEYDTYVQQQQKKADDDAAKKKAAEEAAQQQLYKQAAIDKGKTGQDLTPEEQTIYDQYMKDVAYQDQQKILKQQQYDQQLDNLTSAFFDSTAQTINSVCPPGTESMQSGSPGDH